jgi:hypothetical protein
MTIKLPEIIRDEIITKLNRDDKVVIEGVGMFYLTRFSKDFPVVTKGNGDMVLRKRRKNQKCVRIGFKPSFTMKKRVL